jgi:hypothetical protein
MASPPPPRRRWLLEGAEAAFQHVLIASTVTYDQAEHCPIHIRAWADSPWLILGVVLEAVSAYGGKVIAYIIVGTVYEESRTRYGCYLSIAKAKRKK